MLIHVFLKNISIVIFFKVVERKRTPSEIREEFERLQREREERRLQQRTNPKVSLLSRTTISCQGFCILLIYLSSLRQGTISVGVDATDLFDHYEEEFEELSVGGFPNIEINKMHISQSIEVWDVSKGKIDLYI